MAKKAQKAPKTRKAKKVNKNFQIRLDETLHAEAYRLIYNLKYANEEEYARAYEMIKNNRAKKTLSEIQRELRKEGRHIRNIETLINIATRCGLKYYLD